MKIYYLVPDNNTPSWGVGIIYHHVKALNDAGLEAFLIHQKSGFKVDWLSLQVPVLYWDKRPTFSASDLLVVPEVMVNLKHLKKLPCRKILFVQASSFLFEMLPDDETHLSLGFESAFGIMPHMMPIIEKHTGLQAFMIPPFVADYFYKSETSLHERKKTILIFPKFHQQDFGIVQRLIKDHLHQVNPSGITSVFREKWKLIVMKGKTHREVAELMKDAAFFVATNTFESFNASVVEAMAAGCISVCYEGFGPKDYIRDGVNAFVFSNNEAYRLAEKVTELIDTYEQQQNTLQQIRHEAFKLAHAYNYQQTSSAVVQLFKTKLCPPATAHITS